MGADLSGEGIYVVGFSFPVVPRDQARIRIQISTVHSHEQLEGVVAARAKVGRGPRGRLTGVGPARPT